jgi:hypothetical protein
MTTRPEQVTNYVTTARTGLAARLPTCPDDLLDLYALLVLVLGEDTGLPDVHDAWSVWRNKTDPDHRSLIPFDDLIPEVQQLDSKYLEAIIKTTRELHRRAEVKWLRSAARQEKDGER